ncbi:MAG TPA: TonB-dependent receptor [Bryobacteraceae bacterium]|nr:TonB-dependent receptor [Bryobacteraceae bacterium]
MRVRIGVALAVLSVVIAPALLRADVTGTILGLVTDSTSAVVPGVRVVAINLGTSQRQEATSDSAGQFRLLALPVGRYRVEATAQGFQKFVTTAFDLSVNEQRRVDVVLQVGNIEQQIEVSANALQIETTNTQLGEVVEEKKVLSLPLNGRSYIDLLGLQAGVAPTTAGSMQQDRPVSGGLSAGNVSVNGQRETANAFLVNGGDVSEGRNLGASVIPNLDSVAEFRLITNSFDAEYGRFSGAVMNAVTKSGTNGFHGTMFEFLRNDKLDARNFFDPEKGALKRNQFGYSMGGPILKNKLFWFTDYQGTREVRGIGTGLVVLPTAAMRGGDLAAAPGFVASSPDEAPTVNGSYWAGVLSQRLGYQVTAGMPYSFAGCTSPADCVFPGGVIPSRAFSAPVPATMKYIPLPNAGEDTFASAGQNQKLVDDKAGQRVDFLNKLTGNWSFFYFFDDATLTSPLPASSVPGFPSVTPTRAQQGVLSNTRVFGPTAVNEARLSFMRTATITDKPQAGFAKVGDLGFITGIGTLGIIPSGPPGFEAVPPISFNDFSIGSPTLTTKQPNNTWHASDIFSKVWSKHTLKLGGEFRYLQINERNVCAPNGSFSFDGSETGSDWADYLLGAPSEYIQCSMQFLDSRTKYGGAFAQDSWRVKPNLTLNLGLRWEFSMPWYDTQDKIETIVPGLQSVVFPTAPKGWVVPGDPGIPSTLSPTDYNNLGPRFGLAYSPGFSDGVLGKVFGGPGKTSIRLAYGIYYTAVEDLTLFYEVGDAPYGLYWPSIVPPLFEEPFRTRSDGSSQTQRFPFKFPIPGDPALKTLDYSIYLPIQSSPGYKTDNVQPYAMHFNFTIERTLSPSMILRLGYVGTQGRKLIAQYESNPGDPALCLSLRGSGVMEGTPECGRNGELGVYTRPDGTIVNGTRGPLGPNFGSNGYTATAANSSYNSLQVTLERKAADLTFLTAYTFGKAMDNSSGFNEWINFTNFGLSRSLSQYDITHNFVVSYNYAVPFDRWLGQNRFTSGWSLNGITRFATGFPVNIRQSGDYSLVGSGSTDVPDLVGSVRTQDPRNSGPNGEANLYFFTDAFSLAPLGRFGNSNRRFFHGPGFNNWDFGVHKDTRIAESMAIQFRLEFFNLFNHAQFYNPAGNIRSAQFGQVSGARDPRIGQMSLKFLW